MGRVRKVINHLKPDALEWDEALFHLITERIKVNSDGQISVEFKNGV